MQDSQGIETVTVKETTVGGGTVVPVLTVPFPDAAPRVLVGAKQAWATFLPELRVGDCVVNLGPGTLPLPDRLADECCQQDEQYLQTDRLAKWVRKVASPAEIDELFEIVVNQA